MKKTLSFVLVAAMLLCMIPAFGLFAAEMDLTTIDSADELVALAEAANAGGGDYRRGETIKVTADIDMTGKTLTPFKSMIFTLDFDGHTLSNLHRTVENGSGDVGLLADFATNNGVNGLITNLKLKDCSLTVTGTNSCNVGLVGDANRANITNVTVDGLTITHEGTGNVGTLMGLKRWGYNSDIVATLKNVTIDAPYAQVGIVIGRVSDNDSFNLTSLDAAITVKRSLNDIANDTYTANGADKLKVTADAVSATVVDEQDGNRRDYATEFASIDSAAEFADFTMLVNRGIVVPSGTVKVTADLDMAGIEFEPINKLTFIFDFDGHTVSNLVVTTKGVENYAGMIACLSNNHTSVQNIKLYNCQLNADGVQHVGGVMGKADRAVVLNASLENVTINANGAYLAGGVIGDRPWDTNLSKDMNAELKNVVINANGATLVGLLIARTSGDSKVNITGFKAENVTVSNDKEGFDAAAVGAVAEDGSKGVTTADGAEVKVELSTTATGYVAPCTHTNTKVEGKVDATVDAEGYTGDTVCSDCGEVLAKGETIAKLPAPGTTEPTPPAPTGDSVVALVVLAVVSLLGVAVFSKKRV